MRYFFLLLGVLMTCVSFTVPVEAATLSLSSQTAALHVGDQLFVSIAIDTEKQTINACELSLVFPSDVLEYVSSDDSHSVLSLWVESPHKQTDTTIHLSGITPGGFTQPDANLVTVVFKVVQSGTIRIEPTQATCLLNDGKGTEADLVTENLVLATEEGTSSSVSRPGDEELPEAFVPALVQDPDVYTGAPTIVFSTTDKGSGMDHYEIKEGWFDTYHVAVSPYQMKYPSWARKVVVKALDHAGNERMAEFYPQNLSPWYKQEKIISGIVLGCLLVLSVLFFVGRKLWVWGHVSS